MFNVSICDDSKYDIDKIKNALGMFSKRKHVELSISEFSNPEMLMYEIEDGKIADIFILDVEMPNMDGFELADKIREHTETSIIIFLTSHDEMASMGYKSKALRYVIKLNLERDIEEALDSAIAEISNVNDKTIEGLDYKNKNIRTVQFHPEACPGPQDTAYLFDEFMDRMKGAKNA